MVCTSERTIADFMSSNFKRLQHTEAKIDQIHSLHQFARNLTTTKLISIVIVKVIVIIIIIIITTMVVVEYFFEKISRR